MGTWMCVSFWFLVIFSHVNQWQSVKWANKYKILILNSHFRLRKLRSSYQGTKNVAIYAFSSGKILDVRKIAGVKNMTNIMSDCGAHSGLLKCSNVAPLWSWVANIAQCNHSQADWCQLDVDNAPWWLRCLRSDNALWVPILCWAVCQ